ncbi:MAG TPA: hypothetical protein VMG08_06545 [Allosphingosinicella sp.]|nr:hypothetical protein [Allosphingosinicella sp.]
MINNGERSYASLSSGLLARKGAARPAMRPQGFTSGHGFEDLGWNDMGYAPPPAEVLEEDLPEHVPSSISALTPAPKLPREEVQAEEPEVVAQQRAIAESFPAEVEAETEVEAEAEEAVAVEAPAPVSIPLVKPRAHVVPLPKRPAAKAKAEDGRKAAFTLRLDGERHLRLRLATAVTGQSAQQIVTGALDALLASIPEVEALAERAVSAKSRRN